MKLTFEQLPDAVYDLQQAVNEIRKFLLELRTTKSSSIEPPITVKEAAAFLSLSPSTIFTLIRKGELPVLKRSKRCYFLKSELINYLKEGSRQTSHIESKVDLFLSSRIKKGGCHAQ